MTHPVVLTRKMLWSPRVLLDQVQSMIHGQRYEKKIDLAPLVHDFAVSAVVIVAVGTVSRRPAPLSIIKALS